MRRSPRPPFADSHDYRDWSAIPGASKVTTPKSPRSPRLMTTISVETDYNHPEIIRAMELHGNPPNISSLQKPYPLRRRRSLNFSGDTSLGGRPPLSLVRGSDGSLYRGQAQSSKDRSTPTKSRSSSSGLQSSSRKTSPGMEKYLPPEDLHTDMKCRLLHHEHHKYLSDNSETISIKHLGRSKTHVPTSGRFDKPADRNKKYEAPGRNSPHPNSGRRVSRERRAMHAVSQPTLDREFDRPSDRIRSNGRDKSRLPRTRERSNTKDTSKGERAGRINRTDKGERDSRERNSPSRRSDWANLQSDFLQKTRQRDFAKFRERALSGPNREKLRSKSPMALSDCFKVPFTVSRSKSFNGRNLIRAPSLYQDLDSVRDNFERAPTPRDRTPPVPSPRPSLDRRMLLEKTYEEPQIGDRDRDRDRDRERDRDQSPSKEERRDGRDNQLISRDMAVPTRSNLTSLRTQKGLHQYADQVEDLTEQVINLRQRMQKKNQSLRVAKKKLTIYRTRLIMAGIDHTFEVDEIFTDLGDHKDSGEDEEDGQVSGPEADSEEARARTDQHARSQSQDRR